MAAHVGVYKVDPVIKPLPKLVNEPVSLMPATAAGNAAAKGSPDQLVVPRVDAVEIVDSTRKDKKTRFPMRVYLPVYVGVPTTVRLVGLGVQEPLSV